MANVYLGLGSNIGASESFLCGAIKELDEMLETRLSASRVFITEPWGIKKQQLFYNMAVIYETSLPPLELLEEIKILETKIGRKQRKRWYEREIDIDILFYGSEIFNHEKLTIPHPRLHERNFALIPLLDISPFMMHPIFQKDIFQLYLACPDESDVRLANHG